MKKKSKKKFVCVADADVLNFWKCEECDTVETITPDWYQNNGTPMCCDSDMVYTHTEVKL